MQTINFRVTVVEEYDVVEICGALKVSSCVCLCVCVFSEGGGVYLQGYIYSEC